MDNTQSVVLSLIRRSIDSNAPIDDELLAKAKWPDVMSLCFVQGVLGLCFESIETLTEKCRPPKSLLLRWIGEVVNLENSYKNYLLALRHLTELYGAEDIQMLLLKGYGLSLFWPRPEHRPCGDIDCYNFGKHKLADDVICEKYGISIDNSHHKHTVFNFEGVMVENHYEFLNSVAHRSTAEIERILESEIQKGCTEDSSIKNLYYPSTRFNSLYLLRHSAEHFASVNINLRQVLDWGFFVKSNNIDWEWLLMQLDSVGMKTYLAVLNAICIKHLGFQAFLFPELEADSSLVERSLLDIFHPEVKMERNSNYIKEVVFRFRRWYANRWKHNMVYKESAFQSFITQTVGHIMKPSL